MPGTPPRCRDATKSAAASWAPRSGLPPSASLAEWVVLIYSSGSRSSSQLGGDLGARFQALLEPLREHPLHVPVGGDAVIAFRQQDRPDRRGRQRGQRGGPEAGRHLLALQRDHVRRLDKTVDGGALGLHPSTLRRGPAAHKGPAAAPQGESAPRGTPGRGGQAAESSPARPRVRLWNAASAAGSSMAPPSRGVLLGPLRERPKQLGPARDTIGVVAQAQVAARQTGVDLGPQLLAGVLARAEAGPVPDLVDDGPVVGLPAGEPLRTGQLNAVPPEVVAGAARGRDSDPGDVRFCPGLRVMPNALMTMHLTDSNCLIANRYAVPATLPPRGAHQPPSASSSICASSGSSRFAARTTRGRRSSRCRSQGA